MSFCPKCGAPWRDGARFCTNCGAPAPAGRATETSSAQDESQRQEWVVLPDPPARPAAAPASTADVPHADVRTGERPIAGRGWRIAVSVVLCLVLVLVLPLTAAVATVRLTLCRPVLELVLGNLDLGRAYIDDQETPLIDDLYAEMVNADAIRDYDITQKEFQRFLKKSGVMCFVADRIADYATDLFDGGGGGTVTADEVVAFFRSKADLALSEMDYPFTEEDYQKIRLAFIDQFGSDEISLSDLFDVEESEPALTVLRAVFSLGTLVWLLVISAGLIVGMFAVWRWRFPAPGLFAGIPCLVTGAVWLLGMIGCAVLPVIMHAATDISADMLGVLCYPPAIATGVIALVLLGGGAVLTGISAKTRNKNRRQTA